MEGWEAQCQVCSMLWSAHSMLLVLQLVLRASAGMDYNDFYRLLTLIGEPRLKQVQDIVAHLSSKNS